MSNSNSKITLMWIPQILEVMPISKSYFGSMFKKASSQNPLRMDANLLSEKGRGNIQIDKWTSPEAQLGR